MIGFISWSGSETEHLSRSHGFSLAFQRTSHLYLAKSHPAFSMKLVSIQLEHRLILRVEFPAKLRNE